MEKQMQQHRVTIPRDLGDLDVDYLSWREAAGLQIELQSVKLGGIEILPVMSERSVADLIEDLAEPIVIVRPAGPDPLRAALQRLEGAKP
jgi:hypothetical protein